MRKAEIISYPDLGKIYDGDYYPKLPFGDYICSDQQLPEDQPVFDIRDFGAVPDDLLNTEPIRLACEACRDAGGGVVLVTGGSYRTGTVRLYSNTTLFVASARRILDRNLAEVPLSWLLEKRILPSQAVAESAGAGNGLSMSPGKSRR